MFEAVISLYKHIMLAWDCSCFPSFLKENPLACVRHERLEALDSDIPHKFLSISLHIIEAPAWISIEKNM
jgi:hypothetical protein